MHAFAAGHAWLRTTVVAAATPTPVVDVSALCIIERNISRAAHLAAAAQQ
jgi:hypothetical protein